MDRDTATSTLGIDLQIHAAPSGGYRWACRRVTRRWWRWTRTTHCAAATRPVGTVEEAHLRASYHIAVVHGSGQEPRDPSIDGQSHMRDAVRDAADRGYYVLTGPTGLRSLHVLVAAYVGRGEGWLFQRTRLDAGAPGDDEATAALVRVLTEALDALLEDEDATPSAGATPEDVRTLIEALRVL